MRDAKFNSFRTRIRNALNGGPNFAGEYSLVQIGCGTGCTFVVVASNRTGQPFSFPRGGEDNIYLSLKYQLSSRLLTTQWASYEDSKCYLEFFEFDHGNWKALSKRDVGPVEACYKTIDENLN